MNAVLKNNNFTFIQKRSYCPLWICTFKFVGNLTSEVQFKRILTLHWVLFELLPFVDLSTSKSQMLFILKTKLDFNKNCKCVLFKIIRRYIQCTCSFRRSKDSGVIRKLNLEVKKYSLQHDEVTSSYFIMNCSSFVLQDCW